MIKKHQNGSEIIMKPIEKAVLKYKLVFNSTRKKFSMKTATVHTLKGGRAVKIHCKQLHSSLLGSVGRAHKVPGTMVCHRKLV